MTAYQVTTSAELMENYLQADILDPQDRFIALQTDGGASLLFSIGTDGILYLTKELQAVQHGWTRDDLSSKQAKQDFPGGATCKTFAAAQEAAQTGNAAYIQLAMVLNDGTNDHLYLSLGNSDSDTNWSADPVWVACPFNAMDAAGSPIPPPSPFHIAGVTISEASDGQYVVVDIVRDPNDPVGMLWRFYLQVPKAGQPQWMPHDLAADIDSASYVSCLGRKADGMVDGLYTMGTVTNLAQLIYTPLYNPFNPKLPAAPSRLSLAGGVTAEVIAACRNADNSTDLYAISQGGLYYFASTNQHDEAVAPLLLSHALLSGARALFASAADGQVTIWGLSGSDEVFYLTCPQAEVGTGSAWTVPIPILTAVDAISPYVDRNYSANTFFAHSGDDLIKAVKTPGTGIWTRHSITLAPSETMQPPQPISSYTTHIQVNGVDGQGVPDVPLTLTATSITPVFINHLYYVIGTDPISVATDALGTVTIVQAVHTLSAARFTAVVDETPLPTINPMDAPFQRSAQLNSVASLKAAVITNRDGSTRPFIPSGTSEDDLKKVAQSNTDLGKAYGSLAQSLPPARARRPGRPVPQALVAAGFDDAIETDLGDLFSWLESGIDSVISIIEDAAEDVWHFVAKIAGEIYYGVLDCVEKIVGAVMWIYNAIKVIIEDIIQFLEFLMAWNDILITHRVIKNVLIQFSRYAIGGLGDIKSDIAGLFTELENAIDQWADIPPFGQTPSGTAAANPPPAGQNGAPANLGMHHFKGNAANSSSSYAPPSPGEAILQDLIALVENEAHVLVGAFEEIKTQIIDQFSDLSVAEVMKRFLAILVDTVLETTENILVTLMDVLIQLADGLMDALAAPLDIPVLSWLYNELTGDDLSFLDLICLVAAIPATLVYKLAADAAPFPSGDAFTNGLLNASSFAEVRAQFYSSGSKTTSPGSIMLAGDPVLDEDKVKLFSFVTGLFSLVGSGVLIITYSFQRAADIIEMNPTCLAAVAAVGNVAYVSPNLATLINAETDNWYQELNNALTCVSIAKGLVAIPFAKVDSDPVKIGFAGVETGINVIWFVPVIANAIDNASKVNSSYKSLIPETIGNSAFNVGGILELPIVLQKDPVKQQPIADAQYWMMLIYGVFMVTAGSIAKWGAEPLVSETIGEPALEHRPAPPQLV